MTVSPSDRDRTLRDLIGRVSAPSAATSVPQPRRRWLLRGGVPLAIVSAATLMLAWALRDTIVPLPSVEVMPAVAIDAVHTTTDDAAPRRDEPAVIVQAPGWIEPDPFEIIVQSMVPGVVEKVLVLEGQRVAVGDELVHLVRIDAELALERVRAELGELEADALRARAVVAAADSRTAELTAELERLRPLAEFGGVPASQVTRVELRLPTAQREADIDRAALAKAEAAIVRQRVAVTEAELALARQVIRAPIDGVVLARSVVPGTRIAMVGDGPGEAHQQGLLSLYDPGQLQVRADVPLADASRIGVGTRVRITTDALPERRFEGEVTRVLHKADLQRNTVQVKVRLDEPDPMMKPEMLARVRFLGTSDPDDGSVDSERAEAEGETLVRIPRAALTLDDDERGGTRGRVWVAMPTDRRGVRRVESRAVTFELGDDSANVVVRRGLRLGDPVIVDSDAPLRDGLRVRVRRSEGAAAMEGAN